MREKNRNSIANCIKFPQFITMNVIDGQAGLIIYSSLIFNSLTINNILNIIILLILAGVTIAQLTESGLFNKAKPAEQKSENAQIKEETTLGDYENKIDKIINTSNRDNKSIELDYENLINITDSLKMVNDTYTLKKWTNKCTNVN